MQYASRALKEIVRPPNGTTLNILITTHYGAM